MYRRRDSIIETNIDVCAIEQPLYGSAESQGKRYLFADGDVKPMIII
ncbi:hypothetical protein QWZ16_13840 [Vibrio ostreicida]|uniref:Uncharacterized protein n=1 Tax=Vibrio ostreicida TaxID=526588 RepID=A0ABT8BVV1_9VIBR|nr:hypothetical protein [Vibrio ostreicida]MDN3610783.1 hypothetical protein [Vibrio ostreicida]